MRFEIALAALVAFAAAAPTDMTANGKYYKYISYNPYSTYGRYPAVADAEAARVQIDAHMRRADAMPEAHDKEMDMTKRHETMLPNVAEKRDAEAKEPRKEATYAKYSPYRHYGPYPMAIEEEAAKMEAGHQ